MNSSDTIRVCILAPSLDILGGQSNQASFLLEALRCEPDLEVDFIPHNPRLPGPFRKLQGIRYIRTLVTTLCYWWMLLTRLPRYDVVHVFSAAYYSYLFSVMPAIVIARMFGKHSILNYRSGEAEDHLAQWRTAVSTMRLASEIVVSSGYLTAVFARFGLQARIIPNIVKLSRFRFRDRAPLRPVFLCSRLLEPLYNVGCVLRAFQLIQARYPEATLTIAADGWMRPELEQLACDLELRHTEFIGRIPFDSMPDLYNAADIYLSANNIDNSPASIRESFAAGLLVVCTEAGGTPYLVSHEETGLMVPCGDHRALAASAIRLLEDPVLASRLAQSAFQSVRESGPAAVSLRWRTLYQELVGRLPESESCRGQVA